MKLKQYLNYIEKTAYSLSNVIIIVIIERKDYGGVLSKTARTPNNFESACVGAPDQKLSELSCRIASSEQFSLQIPLKR